MTTFYGFRFDSGRSTTSWKRSNKKTGWCSIAGEIEAFETEKARAEWIEREDLYTPSGLGGGERIAVSKTELRNLCLGMTTIDFNNYLDNK